MAAPVIVATGPLNSLMVDPAALGGMVQLVSGGPVTWQWSTLSTPDALACMRGTNCDFVEGIARVANPTLYCSQPGGYLFQVQAFNADGGSNVLRVEFNALTGTIVRGPTDADAALAAAAVAQATADAGLNGALVAELATYSPLDNPCLTIAGKGTIGDRGGGVFVGCPADGIHPIQEGITYASSNPAYRWTRVETRYVDLAWFDEGVETISAPTTSPAVDKRGFFGSTAIQNAEQLEIAYSLVGHNGDETDLSPVASYVGVGGYEVIAVHVDEDHDTLAHAYRIYIRSNRGLGWTDWHRAVICNTDSTNAEPDHTVKELAWHDGSEYAEHIPCFYVRAPSEWPAIHAAGSPTGPDPANTPIANPTNTPSVIALNTIPAGTYYAAFAWTTQNGQTAASPVSAAVTCAAGEGGIIVYVREQAPYGADGIKLYLGTNPAAMHYQETVPLGTRFELHSYNSGGAAPASVTPTSTISEIHKAIRAALALGRKEVVVSPGPWTFKVPIITPYSTTFGMLIRGSGSGAFYATDVPARLNYVGSKGNATAWYNHASNLYLKDLLVTEPDSSAPNYKLTRGFVPADYFGGGSFFIRGDRVAFNALAEGGHGMYVWHQCASQNSHTASENYWFNCAFNGGGAGSGVTLGSMQTGDIFFFGCQYGHVGGTLSARSTEFRSMSCHANLHGCNFRGSGHTLIGMTYDPWATFQGLGGSLYMRDCYADVPGASISVGISGLPCDSSNRPWVCDFTQFNLDSTNPIPGNYYQLVALARARIVYRSSPRIVVGHMLLKNKHSVLVDESGRSFLYMTLPSGAAYERAIDHYLGVIGYINESGLISRVGTDARGAAVITGGNDCMRLTPSSLAGSPDSGAHVLGEVMVDSGGTMWLCIAAGTPGFWKKVAESPAGLYVINDPISAPLLQGGTTMVGDLVTMGGAFVVGTCDAAMPNDGQPGGSFLTGDTHVPWWIGGKVKRGANGTKARLGVYFLRDGDGANESATVYSSDVSPTDWTQVGGTFTPVIADFTRIYICFGSDGAGLDAHWKQLFFIRNNSTGP